MLRAHEPAVSWRSWASVHEPALMRPTDRPTDGPIDRPIDRPTDQPTDSRDGPTYRPADRPTDGSDDRPTDQPTDRPAGFSRPDRADLAGRAGQAGRAELESNRTWDFQVLEGLAKRGKTIDLGGSGCIFWIACVGEYMTGQIDQGNFGGNVKETAVLQCFKK